MRLPLLSQGIHLSDKTKKKPSVGMLPYVLIKQLTQRRKKGGDPLVSNPANGVKGKTNNDGKNAKPGPTSHSTSSPSFSKKNEDRKDCNDKNNAPSFSKKGDKRKASKNKDTMSQISLFTFLQHLKLWMFRNSLHRNFWILLMRTA